MDQHSCVRVVSVFGYKTVSTVNLTMSSLDPISNMISTPWLLPYHSDTMRLKPGHPVAGVRPSLLPPLVRERDMDTYSPFLKFFSLGATGDDKRRTNPIPTCLAYLAVGLYAEEDVSEASSSEWMSITTPVKFTTGLHISVGCQLLSDSRTKQKSPGAK